MLGEMWHTAPHLIFLGNDSLEGKVLYSGIGKSCKVAVIRQL